MSRRFFPAVAFMLVALPSAAAAGGGSWLEPVRAVYLPGDEATVVGYTQSGNVDEPFYAYLRIDPLAVAADEPDTWPYVHPTDILLGELTVERTAHGGYLSYRAAITFRLPGDLAPAAYEVVVCNNPCTTELGDFIGAYLHVGVDPDYPITREWAPDDPEIVNLDARALIVGPFDLIEAWTLRDGHLRKGVTPLFAPKLR